MRRLVVIAALLMLAACDVPRDPEDTLDRVTGGTLRVGVVGAPPWTVVGNGRVRGVEARLVEALARSLDAEVEWVHGSQDALMATLARFRLDLVIGGLTAASPWRTRVALTRPYLTTTTAVGVARGRALPAALDGVAVAVRADSAAFSALEDEGAVPVRTKHLATFDGPVAAPVWELERLGRALTGHDLAHTDHVLAVPPGENAWIVRVERFLSGRSGEVRRALTAGDTA